MLAQLTINGDHLRVAVIGAGPAGLEAAVTLTKRGFDVTVFEKSDRIGGAVNLADAPIGKYKLGWLIDYYERMIRKLGIRVQLNTECTPQMLRAMDPHAVFVATGSDEFIPPIDGLSGENVLSVREYIRSKPAVSGKRVVVLGAGQTGLEAARMLAQDNTVTVVDMMPDEIPANTDHRLDLFYAKDAGVQTALGHRILRVDGAGVTVASVASGEERVLPADLVVVALGVRPVAELYNEIKDAFPHVCKLGDRAHTQRPADPIGGQHAPLAGGDGRPGPTGAVHAPDPVAEDGLNAGVLGGDQVGGVVGVSRGPVGHHG